MEAFGMQLATGDGGNPVPAPTRGKIENATGADLGGVTVDSGGRGAAIADAHDARAVAVGQEIHVGAGERLDGADGEHLLAHEVAHTMQARNGGQASPRAAAKPLASTSPDSAAEVEADSFADAITSGQRPAPIVESLDATVARAPRGHHHKKKTAGTPDVDVNPDAAPLVASTPELTFEPTALGQESPPQTITITNTGAEPVTIENITAGAAEAAFPTYGALDGALDAGASVDLQFAFRPKKEGPAKALYKVVTDGDITSLFLRLEGRGVSDERSEAPPEKRTDDKSVAIGPISGTAEVKSDRDWEDYAPWNNTSDPVTKTVVEGAKELGNLEYDAGLLAGFTEGLHQAVNDLVKGIYDTAKLLSKVFSGDGVSVALELSRTLDALLKPGLLSSLGKWFADSWTNPDDGARGEFRGKVAGYITMQVVIAIVTEGVVEEIAATGIFAEVINILKGTDALEEATELGASVVGKGASVPRVPPEVAVPPDVPVPDVGGGTPQPDVVPQAPPEGGGSTPQPKEVTTDAPQDVTATPNATESVEQAGQLPLSSGAQPGLPASPETIRAETVAMEQHPNYQATIDEAISKGYQIKTTKGDPHVSVIEVVDEEGNVLQVTRELHLKEGMRYLDLEHEMGHIDQLDRLGSEPPPTTRFVRHPDGSETVAEGNALAGILTKNQNAVMEYHNRLSELVRLMKTAPEDVLNSEFAGVDLWRLEAENRGFGFAKSSLTRWAKEYFPDIPELERQVIAAGFKLEPHTARW